jgi:hypothetical protein
VTVGEIREANPYHPEPGRSPVVLAGRRAELDFLQARLRDAPSTPACVRVTGIRGTGKTVLLKAFSAEAERDGWAVLASELYRHAYSEGTLTALLTQVAAAKVESLSLMAAVRAKVTGAATAVLRTFQFTLTDIGIGWGLDPAMASQAADIGRSLADVATAAVAARRIGCVVILDEAHYLADDPDGDEYPMSLLLATLMQLQSLEIPIAFILSGLPTLDRNIGRARPQAERMFRGLSLGMLSRTATKEAFEGPLGESTMSARADLVDAVIDRVEGYPHFIQLWGAELWSAAKARDSNEMTLALLADVEPQIAQRVEVDIFDFRMKQLDVSDRDVLLAAARCPYPPLRAQYLADELKVDAAEVEESLERLANDGVIHDPADRGEYLFTVPGFERYLSARGQRWGPEGGPAGAVEAL